MRGATTNERMTGTAETFQSTRPMRGATMARAYQDGFLLFQSTRPMRGATIDAVQQLIHPVVSIHAPHAGRDRRADGEEDAV